MSNTVPLVVKWGKESLSLSFAVDSGVKGLKGELEESTGIPADRMKLMAKSKGATRPKCAVVVLCVWGLDLGLPNCRMMAVQVQL